MGRMAVTKAKYLKSLKPKNTIKNIKLEEVETKYPRKLKVNR